MSIAINFTTRETYIAWRRNWKETYKALSTEIRQQKHEIANAFKAGELDKAARFQRDLASSRSLATRMLLTLKDAKATAQEQYLKSKAERQEAA